MSFEEFEIILLMIVPSVKGILYP